MTELRRPEPQHGAHGPLRWRRSAGIEGRRAWSTTSVGRLKTLGTRGRTEPGTTEADPAGDIAAGDIAPVIFNEAGRPSVVVVAAVVVAMLGIGLASMWGWATWSQRSSEPVDDLLPMLAALDQDGDEPPPVSGEIASPVVASAGSGQTATTEQQEEAGGKAAELIVHISGAVLEPGIVRMPAGSRVFEAVQLAGGAAPAADLDRVNLAAEMADGERIHIPAIGEDVDPAALGMSETADAARSAASAVRVDLNQATIVELEELPGVGPATAAAIVQVRDQRGPFLDVEELMEVPGIGEVKLERLRPFLRIG